MRLPNFTAGMQVAVRASLSAGLSLALAELIRLQFPIYAVIAAVIVTDISPLQTRKLGLSRIVSTIVGAICGASLSGVLAPGAWGIGFGILIVMLICDLLHVENSAKTGGFICAIVLLSHVPDAWTYAAFRFVETFIGIVMAWLISCVPPLIRVDAS